jgi:hypothetical protein
VQPIPERVKPSYSWLSFLILALVFVGLPLLLFFLATHTQP